MSLKHAKWLFVAGVLFAMASADCKCTQEGDGGSGGGGGSSRSCPFVFTFDGRKFNYLTDLGGSFLGKNIEILQAEYYQGGVYLLENFQAHDGFYKLKVWETLFESSYFDEASLILARVPEGYQVLNTWSFTSQLGYTSPKDFMTIHDPKPPISATDENGRDVLHEISYADGLPLGLDQDGLSRVIVDFGKIEHPEYAKLVLTAWSQYADLSDTLAPPHVPGTSIETMDEDGLWQVRLLAGKNAGDRHRWVVDLSGLLNPGETIIRVTMAHQPIGRDILDQLLLDDSAPVDVELTRLPIHSAELQYSGRANYLPQDQYHPIFAEDESLPIQTRALLSGRYTRYGDVSSLLKSVDDRFAIMAHGDSVSLSFEAPEENNTEENKNNQPYVFFDADVFYSIKFDVKEHKLTDSIYPLPFHGMKTYPYEPQQWPYAQDRDYRQYDKDFNTRLVTAEE